MIRIVDATLAACPSAPGVMLATTAEAETMNAPVLAYQFDLAEPPAFPELSAVRLLRDAATDDGRTVPAGTEGTIVGVWQGGTGYEVDFEVGLATVEAEHLAAAPGRG